MQKTLYQQFWNETPAVNYLTLASEHGITVNSPALGWRTGISAKVFGRQRRAPSIDTASVRGVCNAQMIQFTKTSL